MSSLDFIMDFELVGLSDEEVIEGFQKLLDEGILFKLQGSYGRAGMELLKAGLITLKPGDVVRDFYGNEIRG